MASLSARKTSDLIKRVALDGASSGGNFEMMRLVCIGMGLTGFLIEESRDNEIDRQKCGVGRVE
jgi:hypothetical protein